MLTGGADSRFEVSLGKWEDVTHSTCPNHAALFPPNNTFSQREISLRKPENQNLIYMYPDPYRTETRFAVEAPWEGFEPGESPALFSGEGRRSRVRIVDSSWIDLKLLKDWCTECEKNHEDCCNSAGFEPSFSDGPSLLVDVVRKCLVRGTTTSRYVTLSYVWGDVNHFVTTRAKLKHFFEPGALGSNGAVENLPRTVDQAMALTHALGERYFWVDALCIVQDGEDKMLQLDAMASIFANACFTIVNAQGKDADAGFRGIPGISTERHIEQWVVSPLPQLRLVKPGSKQVWDGSLLQPWSTRAWTFQEEICARRILYFAHNSVRWVCREAQWSEESESSDCLRTYANAEQRYFSQQSPKLSTSMLPQLDEYTALVNGFNCRALTYPEDALTAFAGVCTRLSTKFAGGMISGLPELFFDICLLWQPQRTSGAVARRKMRIESPDCILPSWSWAGWVTEATWPYTWIRNFDITAPTAVMMQNVRPFYRIELYYRDDQGSKRPIANSWANFGCAALDQENPPQWLRHKLGDSQDYGRIGQYYFTHKSDPTVGFWFPIPICERLELPRMIKFIDFRTRSGKFRLGKPRRTVTRIHALDGTVAGVLWQHAETDEDFVRATSGDFNNRMPIELVAILGCVVPKDDGHLWDASEVSLKAFGETEEEPTRIKEIYNVMWIQWDGDVAYRKATGEVDREIWEKFALEWKDITLG